LRRSEFAFIDFRDSAAGRQAKVQGSSLAVWEGILLVRSYSGEVSRVARHLRWPEHKVQGGVNYAEAVPEDIREALSENDSVNFDVLKRMAPHTFNFAARKGREG